MLLTIAATSASPSGAPSTSTCASPSPSLTCPMSTCSWRRASSSSSDSSTGESSGTGFASRNMAAYLKCPLTRPTGIVPAPNSAFSGRSASSREWMSFWRRWRSWLLGARSASFRSLRKRGPLARGSQQLFLEKLANSGENVTVAGSYGPANVPQLMSQIDWVVVPSRWWENSPLVIQEAFMHGRPVICTGIGGMAEKVAHGVNGLHFVTSDRAHLAETIRTAVQTPGLWERLRSGIPPVYGMEEHVGSPDRSLRRAA